MDPFTALIITAPALIAAIYGAIAGRSSSASRARDEETRIFRLTWASIEGQAKTKRWTGAEKLLKFLEEAKTAKLAAGLAWGRKTIARAKLFARQQSAAAKAERGSATPELLMWMPVAAVIFSAGALIAATKVIIKVIRAELAKLGGEVAELRKQAATTDTRVTVLEQQRARPANSTGA